MLLLIEECGIKVAMCLEAEVRNGTPPQTRADRLCHAPLGLELAWQVATAHEVDSCWIKVATSQPAWLCLSSMFEAVQIMHTQEAYARYSRPRSMKTITCFLDFAIKCAWLGEEGLSHKRFLEQSKRLPKLQKAFVLMQDLQKGSWRPIFRRDTR